MPILTKELDKTSNTSLDEREPIKQVSKPVDRDSRGRLLPGSTANPNGRPPAGKTIVEKFRNNPGAQAVINKLYDVANTLDEDVLPTFPQLLPLQVRKL